MTRTRIREVIPGGSDTFRSKWSACCGTTRSPPTRVRSQGKITILADEEAAPG